ADDEGIARDRDTASELVTGTPAVRTEGHELLLLGPARSRADEDIDRASARQGVGAARVVGVVRSRGHDRVPGDPEAVAEPVSHIPVHRAQGHELLLKGPSRPGARENIDGAGPAHEV